MAILCLSFERKENCLYYIGYVEIIYADTSMEPVEIYGMDISKQDTSLIGHVTSVRKIPLKMLVTAGMAVLPWLPWTV